MAIKGLNPELREVGQIRLGKIVDMGNGKTRPERLRWFEVLRLGDGGTFSYDGEVHKRIGARPTAIQVFLPGEKMEDVFHYELSMYCSKGRPRYCWGDGDRARSRLFPGDFLETREGGVVVIRAQSVGQQRTFVQEPWRRFLGDLGELVGHDGLEPYQKDGRSGYRVTAPTVIGPLACSCPLMEREGDKVSCKPHAILSVLLGDNPALGSVYKFRTTSWNTIKGILGGLQQVQGLFGTLMAVPLHLCCSEIERMDPDSGKKRKLVVAHLEYRKQLDVGLTEHRRFMALRGEVVRAALPPAAAVHTDPDDPAIAAELVEEFHPEVEAEGMPEEESVEAGDVVELSPEPEVVQAGPADPFGAAPAAAPEGTPPAASVEERKPTVSDPKDPTFDW